MDFTLSAPPAPAPASTRPSNNSDAEAGSKEESSKVREGGAGAGIAVQDAAGGGAPKTAAGVTHSVFLPRRSLLVMRGPARFAWQHGIAPRKTDVVAGTVRPRARRVSLTIRRLSLLAGEHEQYSGASVVVALSGSGCSKSKSESEI